MAKAKSRPRKAYRPRPVDPTGGLKVIGAHLMVADEQQPIPADDCADLNLAYRLAFNIMRTGPSTEETWSVVTVALNIALILAERGIGSDCEPYIVKALDGAFRAWLRGQRTGKWRYDGAAINDIELALEVHDEQIQIATKAELRNALQEVHRRITHGDVYQTAA